MSVLNTFALVFETEGDELTLKKVQQLDAAGKKLEQTNKKTGNTAEKAGHQTKTAAQQFSAFKRGIAGAIAPALVLGAVLSRTLNFAAQGEQLLFMAKSANMAAGEFQKLAIANERFGGSREGAAGMMSGLASQLQALKFGQSAPLQDAAMMYGLNLQGEGGNLAEGNELLRNVAQTMERLDTSAQLDLGRRIGLDEATIRLLQQGVASFDAELARAEKRRIFTDEDIKRAQELEMALRDAKLGLQEIWAEIARWVMPAVKDLVEMAGSGLSYMSEHADVLKVVLGAISAILAGIAISSLAAWAPWIGAAALVGAVAALFGLFYEDWKVWTEGGSSALAPLWESLKDIGEWFQNAPGWIQGVVNSLKMLLNPFQSIKQTIASISNLWDMLVSAWNNAPGVFKMLAGKLADFGASNAIALADSNPMAAVAGVSTAYTNYRNSQQTNTYNLSVTGSKNPAEDGAALMNHARGDDFADFTSGQEI